MTDQNPFAAPTQIPSTEPPRGTWLSTDERIGIVVTTFFVTTGISMVICYASSVFAEAIHRAGSLSDAAIVGLIAANALVAIVASVAIYRAMARAKLKKKQADLLHADRNSELNFRP